MADDARTPKIQKTSSPYSYAPIPTYPPPSTISSPSVSTTATEPPPPPPTRSPPLTTLTPAERTAQLVSRFKDQGKALISSQRPWPQLLDFTALTRPFNAGDALVRLQRNVSYFRSNYIIFSLAVLSLSLIWHLGSLFAFVALLAAWFFLYFSRDQPLVLFGRTIDEGTVLGVLSVATVFALLFSDVGSTVFGAILVALAIICLHAVFRKTDDLFLDETEATSGGLVVPSFVIPVQQQQQQQSFVRIL
ncbi:PRA1 family protein F3-like [Zingiber officinale]|uniref:PRA1 family protein n=1 Tax=Zingiber officinale TaxID=94328 RepID=A0A8J5LD12_ZINOF|nr:PRA1 family protein F3-like [Zingiber officinale]XP_042461754.1 PRA1 family protein F3-like [Zingiber officinale]KAG6523828.1 hypothetical protein ZIOFF_013715 [Zingiber officinale]KAG6527730.1 hypothetical protein ZIOFF_009856 [Zingiber officinale]